MKERKQIIEGHQIMRRLRELLRIPNPHGVSQSEVDFRIISLMNTTVYRHELQQLLELLPHIDLKAEHDIVLRRQILTTKQRYSL